jgi:hypothetical protein
MEGWQGRWGQGRMEWDMMFGCLVLWYVVATPASILSILSSPVLFSVLGLAFR